MATHVNAVSDVWVPSLGRDDFSAQVQTGDILFLSGQEPISRAIEGEIKSPWSHVGYVWILPGIEPLFIEAVFKFGVRVSRLVANYIGPYDGDAVLCRRVLEKQGVDAIIAKALSRLGDGYDWKSEVQQAEHNLLGFLPEHATQGELYCSGLVWYASTAWSPALQKPNPAVMPSPEDVWTDPTVEPICKLLKGAK